ncbi:MAG: 1-acyl-sn-glycerol-3-phosphate acyltransferase [Gammaproteobacteria bacterium]|nr:1-acyl-sn-glycerol-3-phosphate acyltransferase [Gammaproteobacteria bacterium]
MNTIRQWLGSLVFTGWLLISWIPYALGVLLVGGFSHRLGFAVARAWAATVVAGARLLCGIRFEVEGLEHLPQRNTVVMIKHSSAFETLAELTIFPPQCWVLKRELMWIPIFGWALKWLRPIAINRAGGRNAVDQVVAQGSERLREGLWVMIFPEGTRTAVGQTRRYGLSAVLLAQKNGLPVVPVAHNAGVVWPRRGLLKRPGTVRMVIGPPIDTVGRDVREINAQVQDWIESRVAELTGLPKAEPPPRRGAVSR